MSRYFVQEVYGKRFSGVNPSVLEHLLLDALLDFTERNHLFHVNMQHGFQKGCYVNMQHGFQKGC